MDRLNDKFIFDIYGKRIAKQNPKKSELQGQKALQSSEYQRVGGYKSIKG